MNIDNENQESQRTPLTAQQINDFAANLIEPIKAGVVPNFDTYIAENPNARIDETDFRQAVLVAEAKAATDWGYGPDAGKKMSREAWEALPPMDQVKYIHGGGKLYDLPAPKKTSPAFDYLTNKKGERIALEDFNALSPQQRMDWSVAR